MRSREGCRVQQQGVSGDLRGQKGHGEWKEGRQSTGSSFLTFGRERQERDSCGWGPDWGATGRF